MDATTSAWVDPDPKPVSFRNVIRVMSEYNPQHDAIMLPDGDFQGG